MRSVAATLAVVGVIFALPINGDPTTTAPETPTVCDSHAHQHSASEHRKWSKNLWNRYEISNKAKAKHRHMLQCAEGPQARRAMHRQWKVVKQKLLPPNHDLWLRIGRCEQPGGGYGGVNWRVAGPTYEGGLGFWYGTWDAYRPASYPDNAGHASWRQQMRVANNVLHSVGVNAWGCA